MADIFAFSSDEVSRVVGITPSRLRYWARVGLVTPSIETADAGPFAHLYSFRDMVALRAIARLRDTYGVSLQELRQLNQWFSDHYDAPWASLSFSVVGRHVFFKELTTGEVIAARPAGQSAIPVDMTEVEREVERAIRSLRSRQPHQIGRIDQNRYVVHNAPVLAGTRIMTSSIWNFHEAGYSSEQILREYPSLQEEDVAAAITYEQAKRNLRAG